MNYCSIFSGLSCTSDLTCADKPCQNNGYCTYEQMNDVISYKCTCNSGFEGDQCHRRLGACASKPCLNGGTCFSDDYKMKYKCQCKKRFSGLNCEIDENPCSSNPCYNGGRCINMYNDYKCVCRDGKRGKQCANGEYCNHIQCQNSGSCVEKSNGGALCKCPKGFTGNRCQVDRNECFKSQLCSDIGLCINTWGSYHCNCSHDNTAGSCAVASTGKKGGLPIMLIIACAVGSIIFILLLFVIVHCYKKSRRRYKRKHLEPDVRKYPLDRYTDVYGDSYELGEMLPPNPPPRGVAIPPCYDDNDQASAAMYDPSMITFSSSPDEFIKVPPIKFCPARTSIEYQSEEEDMKSEAMYHWDYSEVLITPFLHSLLFNLHIFTQFFCIFTQYYTYFVYFYTNYSTNTTYGYHGYC